MSAIDSTPQYSSENQNGELKFKETKPLIATRLEQLSKLSETIYLALSNNKIYILERINGYLTVKDTPPLRGTGWSMMQILNNGALISSNQDKEYFAHIVNGEVTFDEIPINKVSNWQMFIAIAKDVTIIATKARIDALTIHENKPTLKQLDSPFKLPVDDFFHINNVGFFFMSGKTWYQVLARNETLEIQTVSDKIDKSEISHAVKEYGGFHSSRMGLQFARVDKNGVAHFESVSDIQITSQFDMQDISGSDVLIRNAQGLLYLAKINKEKIEFQQIDTTAFGFVRQIKSVNNNTSVIIRSSAGEFIAHLDHGSLKVDPIFSKQLPYDIDFYSISNSLSIISSPQQLFLLSKQLPFNETKVIFKNKTASSTFRPNIEAVLQFEILGSHCASILDKDRIFALITNNGKIVKDSNDARVLFFNETKTGFETAISFLPSNFGEFQIQLFTYSMGKKILIGLPQVITIENGKLKEKIQEGIWWAAGLLIVFFALINLTSFVNARKSEKAWNRLNDDSFTTIPIRILCFILIDIVWARLWILDLYFKKSKELTRTVPPFYPVPIVNISNRIETSLPSVSVLSPPWQGQRIWIQGHSGMGKSALFTHVVNNHFQENTTAFDAFKKWGAIIVAFSARDYADGEEDKFESDWVIKGIKGALSRAGLSVKNDTLLLRLILTGTIAVAIDGLHEAGKTNSVTAFVRSYPNAPIFITSQEAGGPEFINWSLPTNMNSFIQELLQLYLDEKDVGILMESITQSELRDKILSGYDVRLLIDIVKEKGTFANLPSDKLGLYKAVVERSWPFSLKNKMEELKQNLAAAAWSMISKKEPQEDVRRIKPDTLLSTELLQTLAGAPDNLFTSIRLIRKVGHNYEFIHDQMHAYLAATWFTLEVRNVDELEYMLSELSIWKTSPFSRDDIWEFVAKMLDTDRLFALWGRVDDKPELDILRRKLKNEAERREDNML